MIFVFFCLYVLRDNIINIKVYCSHTQYDLYKNCDQNSEFKVTLIVIFEILNDPRCFIILLILLILCFVSE